MLDRLTPYGIGVTVSLPHREAVRATRAALAAAGFGVLTEIDFAATLGEKLGVELPPYVVLGACHAPSAHRALLAEPNAGLLLPCNVAVYTTGRGDRCVVAALDPMAALSMAGNAALESLAADVARRLRQALTDVAASGPRVPEVDRMAGAGPAPDSVHATAEAVEEIS